MTFTLAARLLSVGENITAEVALCRVLRLCHNYNLLLSGLVSGGDLRHRIRRLIFWRWPVLHAPCERAGDKSLCLPFQFLFLPSFVGCHCFSFRTSFTINVAERDGGWGSLIESALLIFLIFFLSTSLIFSRPSLLFSNAGNSSCAIYAKSDKIPLGV